MTPAHTTGTSVDRAALGGVGVAELWGAVPPSRRRLRAWAKMEPALAGLDWDRLTGLLWDPKVAWHRKDELLAALIRLSRSDPEATTAVAICLSPGLWAKARHLIVLVGHDDGWGELLAGLCDRIARYDLDRRPQRIAANLILDARQHLYRAVDAHVRHSTGSRPEGDISQLVTAPAPEVSAKTILALAEQAGVIAPIDTAIITATRLVGLSIKEAAALLGVDYEAAKKRRQRAEPHLVGWWNTPEHDDTPSRPARPARVIALRTPPARRAA